MAFTETQKVNIRFFLGYPDIYRQINPRLENAITIMGTRPETQLKVEVILSKLEVIYGVNPGDPSQIDNALSKAGLKEVESADDRVVFGDSSAQGSSSSAILNTLNDYGRQLVGALSSWCGVPIASNVFGKAGYIGDVWSTWSNHSHGPFMMGM